MPEYPTPLTFIMVPLQYCQHSHYKSRTVPANLFISDLPSDRATSLSLNTSIGVLLSDIHERVKPVYNVS